MLPQNGDVMSVLECELRNLHDFLWSNLDLYPEAPLNIRMILPV